MFNNSFQPRHSYLTIKFKKCWDQFQEVLTKFNNRTTNNYPLKQRRGKTVLYAYEQKITNGVELPHTTISNVPVCRSVTEYNSYKN
jgi:hypothetical protein